MINNSLSCCRVLHQQYTTTITTMTEISPSPPQIPIIIYDESSSTLALLDDPKIFQKKYNIKLKDYLQ